VNWAKELELTGLSRPGTPGIVIVEGNAIQVTEYVSRLRGLHWKKMSNVCEESTPYEEIDTFSIDKFRKFSDFVEIQCDSLGDIIPLFEKANLMHMFYEGTTLPNSSK